MERGGAGMAKTSVPKVDAGRERPRCSVSGGRRLNGVQVAGTLTAVQNHPGTGVLYRKTKLVKFHSYRVITRKSFDGN
jgi:hypothetical protein